MAEFHCFGQITSASNFSEPHSLFCRYSLQAGPNWTLVSGFSEGQTACGKADYLKRIIWAQHIDLHYVSRGMQGWPKLIVQVSCLDEIGRSWVVGYGSSSIPAVPGFHSIEIPCWVPAATTITDKLRQDFIGGSNQLADTDIIYLGSDRSKLNTQSKGTVKLDIYVLLRNFAKFGVEYK